MRFTSYPWRLARRAASAAGLLATLTTASQAQAGTYSLSPFTGAPVSASVTPGTWSLQAIGGAWNPWGGPVAGCNGSGGGCSQGWTTLFSYAVNGGAFSNVDSGLWQTGALALTNSPVVTFVINDPAQLTLQILDNPYYDNSGSNIEVRLAGPVVATPEPTTLALLATGLVGMLGVSRRGTRRG